MPDSAGVIGGRPVHADLVDEIYEAAFFPDRWPGVLDRLATIAEARGGLLFTANPLLGVLRSTTSAALRDDFARYANDGWLFRGTRFSRLSGSRRAGFGVEHDVFTDAELADDPGYRDFLRPIGLGWAAGTAMVLPTDDLVVVSLERDYVRGPVERAAIDRLDALRPHLARSTLMAARLQLARAEAAATTLQQLGLPAIVLDVRGRAIFANGLAEVLSGTVRWGARDRVTLSDPVAQSQLRVALAGLDVDAEPTVRSFAVRGDAVTPAMAAHLLPLRGHAIDLFAGATALLVLSPATAPHAPPLDLIQSLFDLTAAEARVARSLAGGDRIDDIAAAGGVSRNTVRSQLQAVMDKTGSRRQADVVALLAGIGIAKTV